MPRCNSRINLEDIRALHNRTDSELCTLKDLIKLVVYYKAYGGNPGYLKPFPSELLNRYFGDQIEESFEKAEHAARQGKGHFEIPYKREMLVLGAWTDEMQQREEGIREIYWKKANEYLELAKSGDSPTQNLDKALRLSDCAGRKLPSEEVYCIVLKNDKGFIYSCFGINEVPA